jgi:hypothetical protein
MMPQTWEDYVVLVIIVVSIVVPIVLTVMACGYL